MQLHLHLHLQKHLLRRNDYHRKIHRRESFISKTINKDLNREKYGRKKEQMIYGRKIEDTFIGTAGAAFSFPGLFFAIFFR